MPGSTASHCLRAARRTVPDDRRGDGNVADTLQRTPETGWAANTPPHALALVRIAEMIEPLTTNPLTTEARL